MQQLEAATEEARQANLGVAKAKRVLKELQAQVGVAGLGAPLALGPALRGGCWAAPSTSCYQRPP